MKVTPSTRHSSSTDVASSRFDNDTRIKLKALKYPVYYGDEELWLPWWEQYEATVHLRNIPEATKHQILIDDECLKSETLKAMKGINPNSRNYGTTIATLRLRFGDSVKLASSYHSKLEGLPG